MQRLTAEAMTSATRAERLATCWRRLMSGHIPCVASGRQPQLTPNYFSASRGVALIGAPSCRRPPRITRSRYGGNRARQYWTGIRLRPTRKAA